MVGDSGFFGVSVEVNVDLVEVLAAAEALEAVVNAVGFTVEHDVEFPEGAFYFYEAVVEGVVVGLLEGEGGVFYGLLANEGDGVPVFGVGVELDGLSPDEGRIRDGGQRILDVGNAVSVGVGCVGVGDVEVFGLTGVPGTHSAAGPDGLTDLLKVVECAVGFRCLGVVAVFEFGEGNVPSVGDVVFVLVGNHDGLTEVVAEPLDVGELSVGHGDAGPVFAEFAAAVPGEFVE